MDLGKGLGHLTYSTLVHQTDNWDQLWKSVNTYLPAVKARVAPHQKFGVCLRTSAPSAEMLSQDPTKRADLKKFFADNDLYLYTANAGNGSISAFDLRVPEEPRQLQLLHLRRGANPWGLALDPSGRTLFVVDPRAVGGVPDIVGNRLHVLAVGRDGRLEEIDDARVKLPVSANASPLGIAVVPRR